MWQKRQDTHVLQFRTMTETATQTDETGKSKKKTLPTHIAYLIVWTRVLLSGFTTLLIMYVLHPFLGLPVLPPLPTATNVTMVLFWLIAFGIEALVVIYVLFWPMMAVSWGIAWLVSPFVRQEFREHMEERKAEEESEAESETSEETDSEDADNEKEVDSE